MVPALYGVRRRDPADRQRQARRPRAARARRPRRRAVRAIRATTGRRCWRASSPRSSGFRSVGIDDDFFTLGGDSISSIAVSGRARKAGLHITPRDVFRRRTVAALAAASSAVRRRAVATEPDSGVGTDRRDADARRDRRSRTRRWPTSTSRWCWPPRPASPAAQLELVLAGGARHPRHAAGPTRRRCRRAAGRCPCRRTPVSAPRPC